MASEQQKLCPACQQIVDNSRPWLVACWLCCERLSVEEFMAFASEHGKASGFWGRAAAREIQKRKDAERQRDAARAALESIAANSCCDRCQEAALVAKKALGDEAAR